MEANKARPALAHSIPAIPLQRVFRIAVLMGFVNMNSSEREAPSSNPLLSDQETASNVEEDQNIWRDHYLVNIVADAVAACPGAARAVCRHTYTRRRSLIRPIVGVDTAVVVWPVLWEVWLLSSLLMVNAQTADNAPLPQIQPS